MPIQPTYPGVYIEEVPSGVRTIAGVSTSVTAFIGRTLRGPENKPVTVFNIGEFNRIFGGMWTKTPMGYAIDDYFANGGAEAIILRLFEEDGVDTGDAASFSHDSLNLVAANPGEWGNNLSATISHPEDAAAAAEFAKRYPGVTAGDLFNLVVRDSDTGAAETYLNITHIDSARRVDRVLAEKSSLARLALDGSLDPDIPASRPSVGTTVSGDDGKDGTPLTNAKIIGDPDKKTGIYALKQADIFNILCIPPDQRGISIDKTIWEKAAQFCKEQRAFLIVDPPSDWHDKPLEAAQDIKAKLLLSPLIPLSNADNAAVYFPDLMKRDPLLDGQINQFAPCGTVAGIMARTDLKRGIWKAPAGLEATINNAENLAVNMDDNGNGLLNPLGVNSLRSFKNTGKVCWGSRTLKGSDALSDDYKYVPVRRLALYIEESLYRGTQWVVFEPNAEPLWAQIRLNVGSFMQRLFLQGAFKGTSKKEAYFVRCDATTTSADDINRGIVNIAIGFAPLQPVEFVIMQIQQIRSTI